MGKLTKIIATIGPACESKEKITSLIEKGVNVFRFNFKHNTVQWHSDRIKRVNEVAMSMGKAVGVLIDLAGPEIRMILCNDSIELKIGDEIRIFAKITGYSNGRCFSVTRPSILPHLADGQQIVADDGAFRFTVVKKNEEIYLKSNTNGVLLNNKTLNVPGADIPLPALNDRDVEGLKLAAENDADFIALSFVRSPDDIQTVKSAALKYGVKAKVISKIEAEKAIINIDQIIDATDGVMVARGDLGVEIPIEQVPYYQKSIIKKCMIAGKFVITATQMLESMINLPSPTRAEVSDVANAIYDYTDAIMLSGETAMGKYPEQTVEVMRNAALFYEPKLDRDIRSLIQYKATDTTAMICDTAYNLYRQYKQSNQPISGFVVFTQSGKTAEMISRYRPLVPIFAFTPYKQTGEMLTINFGVVPLVFKFELTDHVEIDELKRAEKILSDMKLIKKDNGKLIVVHGDQWGTGRGATTIRIL